MHRRITKLAAAIGLAVGLVVIGGSVVGGIALAMDHGQPPVAPAPASDSTSDGHDVAGLVDDQDGDDQDGDGHDSDDQDSDSDDLSSDEHGGTGSDEDSSSTHDDDGTMAEPDDDTVPDDD